MIFWGVEVKSGELIPADCELSGGNKLILTQATLGDGSSPKKSILQCHVRNRSPVFLCTLLPDKLESRSLNLEFGEEDNVKFSVVGPTSIHLAGFVKEVPRDSNDMDYKHEAYEEDIAGTELKSEKFSDYDIVDGLNRQRPQEKLIERSCSDLEARELGKQENFDLQKIEDHVFKSTIVPFVEEVVYYTLAQAMHTLKPRTVGQALAVLGYQGESSISEEESSEKDSCDPSPTSPDEVEEELCALYVDFEGCQTRVAYGKMSSSRVLDGETLPCGVVKVKIENKSAEIFAPLPFPVNDEITLVRHAVDKYIAWPRNQCYTFSEFKSANACKQSPNLDGFVERVSQHLDGDGYEDHAYGKDFVDTDSEESEFSCEESFDYDFSADMSVSNSEESRDYDLIDDDDDVTKYSPSTVPNSGVVIEKNGDSKTEEAKHEKNITKTESKGPDSGMSQEELQKIVNDVVKSALPKSRYVKASVQIMKKEMLRVLVNLFPGTVNEALMMLTLLFPPKEGSLIREKDERELVLCICYEGSEIQVAHGLMTLSRVIDDTILPSDVASVKVTRALECFAPLPLPLNDKITKVHHAVNKFVPWPTSLCLWWNSPWEQWLKICPNQGKYGVSDRLVKKSE